MLQTDRELQGRRFKWTPYPARKLLISMNPASRLQLIMLHTENRLQNPYLIRTCKSTTII